MNQKAFEDKTAKSFMGLYEVKQGVLAHDRGWFGENREGFGPDYNFELMFNSPRFLKKIWSPKPVLGLTQTSTGGSSLYYGGITWDFDISKNWFVTGHNRNRLYKWFRQNFQKELCQEEINVLITTIFVQLMIPIKKFNLVPRWLA